MKNKLVFVVGSPRSGSTLLARMLASHSLILGRPEPHLVTPLAHLGYYAKVDRAPYDAILAAEATKEFVADLPRGEDDYLDACRAYLDVLYSRMLATHPEKQLFLDKTPAYALVLPFLRKVYPEALYVVLTRHPLAIFSSYAESFFDGDYAAAHSYNPILERYVPAIASFVREPAAPCHHVMYEALVREPEAELQRIFAFLGVPHEPGAVAYGEHEHQDKGLGDPIGVKKHARPTDASVSKWAVELVSQPARLELCRTMIARLDPDDLKTWGYPVETLWQPLEAAGASGRKPGPRKLDRYHLQRRAIVRTRALLQRKPALRKPLETVRLALDVLLRS